MGSNQTWNVEDRNGERCEWIDGSELSILRVRANGHDYAAEISPYSGTGERFAWAIYRGEQEIDWNLSDDRDEARSYAEHFLTVLIESDRNEGEAK